MIQKRTCFATEEEEDGTQQSCFRTCKQVIMKKVVSLRRAKLQISPSLSL